MPSLRFRQGRVDRGHDDPLLDRSIDQRAECGVAGMPHDDDTVRTCGHGIAEMRDHGFRVPVGIQQTQLAPHIGGSGLGPVLNDGAVTIPYGTARIKPDRHAFARFGERRAAQQAQGQQAQHQNTFHEQLLFPILFRTASKGAASSQSKHRRPKRIYDFPATTTPPTRAAR